MTSSKHPVAGSHESFHNHPSSLLDPSDWSLFYPTPLEPLVHSFDQLDTWIAGAVYADLLVFVEPAMQGSMSDLNLFEDLLQAHPIEIAQTGGAQDTKNTVHEPEMVEVSVHDLQLLLSAAEASIAKAIATEVRPPGASEAQQTLTTDGADPRKTTVLRGASSSAEPTDPARDGDGNSNPGNNNACDFPGCGKLFTRPFNLRTHKKTHESVRMRDFRCDECGAAFLRVHDLVRHEVKHDPSRWHLCSGCGRGFSRVDALKRHIKTGNGACRDAVA